ncbi:DUF1367 family protein [Grimontia marina]|uniref:DUF1367 family protein n=1 Tax=Grimontia marina TaxID=646534 RepID=A0A128EYM9_9GAMM|nr:DUF1367 family protein [Grimontia marina]CZF79682.1 hypothetical protein GMA8713_01082 [Grimontia marina]
MMEFSLVKVRGGMFVPHTDEDKELADKKRIGTVLTADFRETRHPKFHRKFFVLLKLGFDYWTPVGGTVSPHERNLVYRFASELSKWGGEQQTMREVASGFLDAMAQKRANLDVEKSFEAYRKWAVMEAGFYTVVHYPNGTVRKEAKSISFARMDNTEFSEVYRAVFNVIWNHTLQHHFDREADVEQAVNQLMGFA